MMLPDPRVIGGVVLAVVLAYAIGRAEQRQHDAKAYQAERTKAILAAAGEQLKAVDAARAEEQRRTAAQTKVAEDATKDADAARGDARDARDAADRLRKRVADLLAAARAPKDLAAPHGGPPAGDPLDVLTDVLGRADKRAGELAAYADRARIAGLACEASYDALTVTDLPAAAGTQ